MHHGDIWFCAKSCGMVRLVIKYYRDKDLIHGNPRKWDSFSWNERLLRILLQIFHSCASSHVYFTRNCKSLFRHPVSTNPKSDNNFSLVLFYHYYIRWLDILAGKEIILIILIVWLSRVNLTLTWLETKWRTK